MKRYSSFLYVFWQFFWGFPQNAVGALLFAVLRIFGKTHRYRHAVVTHIRCRKNHGGITAGMFVFLFLSEQTFEKDPDYVHDITVHEYGHTVQSLLLGPVFPLCIGLPSSLWAGIVYRFFMRKRCSYHTLYCEGWANVLGSRVTGESFRTPDFLQHGRYNKPMKGSKK